jgi:hypothetical protein
LTGGNRFYLYVAAVQLLINGRRGGWNYFVADIGLLASPFINDLEKESGVDLLIGEAAAE